VNVRMSEARAGSQRTNSTIGILPVQKVGNNGGRTDYVGPVGCTCAGPRPYFG